MKNIEICEWLNGNFRAYSTIEHNFSWATFNDKGDVVEESQAGPFAPGLTDEEKASAKEFILGVKKAPYQNAFIRFGNLPKTGKSKNYATNQFENGVSVYDARWDLVKEAYVRSGEALDGAAITYIFRGAPVYLVTGDVTGVGSDGEPVLKNVKILSEVSYDLEKKGYVIKE